MTPRHLLVLTLLTLCPGLAMADGSLDSVANGHASGWALDPGNPRAPIQIHFYSGGPAGQGRLLGSTRTSIPRPDVNRATGHPGNHGFRFRLPANHRGQVFAYAIIPAQGNPLLAGSPRGAGSATPTPNPTPTPPAPNPTPTLPAPTPTGSARAGRLEAYRNGAVSGWAYDANNPSSAIQVHLYHGGPAGQGRLLGGVQTDLLRRDVNGSLRIQGRHGFRYTLPAGLRSGGTIYAYAIVPNRPNQLLAGSPLSYGSVPAPTPSPSPSPNPGPAPSSPGAPGSVDGIDRDGVLTGWASSPEVFVEIDRTSVGSVEANLPHGGVSGERGFAFGVPNTYRDGRTHMIEAFVGSGINRTSLGSLSFNLARPGGSLTLRGSLLRVQTAANYGAAITAITIRGRQIVNNKDHGRQVQMAWNYGEAERRMPTEAGRNRDQGASTSVVLDAEVRGAVLTTRCLAAYWGKPGTLVHGGGVGSPLVPTRNKSDVTPDVLEKRVEVDYLGNPNLIRLDVSVTPLDNEPEILIEIPAIYLERRDFSLFLHFDPQTGSTSPSIPSNRNQIKALILSSPDRSIAVGVYSPDATAYGHWDFGANEGTTKINAMGNRHRPIPGRVAQRYRSYLAVGSVDEVVAALRLARSKH